ncbi:MAG: hypothetical protein AVDCRST_MAG12-1292 [uncultured Rubrobacteraceae bacterium]|uniref:Uncharacterized protein n=1 Tax=uncultured Rubrobacteraceae bacterium TaxID=349277 RepID=A0A6J4RX84_9ACTN|nr:MAG: hypothetical protein AVDCRST_MAG12-1292 [uncultured Rubrobacteraceae bacterium]
MKGHRVGDATHQRPSRSPISLSPHPAGRYPEFDLRRAEAQGLPPVIRSPSPGSPRRRGQRGDDPGPPYGRAPAVRVGHGRPEARDVGALSGGGRPRRPADPVRWGRQRCRLSTLGEHRNGTEHLGRA